MAPPSKYFDLSVFEAPSPERNYWFGFLAADGCVHKTYITIRLKDLEHVEKFQSFCKSQHKIVAVEQGSGFGYQLTIGSRKLVDLLATFNIGPAKSYTVSPPEEFTLDRDYWRGVIDGDGCLRITHKGFPAIELVGSKAMCDGFLRYIKTFANTKTKVLPRAGVYRVSVGGMWIKKVIEVLYQDATICLDRKSQIAKSILSVKSKRGPYIQKDI